MTNQSTRREFLGATVVAALPFHASPASKLLVDAVKQYDRAWESSSDAGREEAIGMLTKVIEIDPSIQLAYFYRGKGHYWSGRYKDASADFAKALQLSPSDETGLAGSFYYEALKDLERRWGGREAVIENWVGRCGGKAGEQSDTPAFTQ